MSTGTRNGHIPERVLEMNRLQREEGLTLREIGDRYEISHERVRQLLKEAGFDPITRAERGAIQRDATDEQIRAALNGEPFSAGSLARDAHVSDERAREFLRREGIVPPIQGPHRVWGEEGIIEAIQRWHRLYGECPGAMDWNPALARALGHPEIAQRWETGNWPGTGAVQYYFGSFNAGIKAAGYTPRPPGWRKELLAH